MATLSYKVHQSKYGVLLAVCDKRLVGKTLKDKKKDLEFFVNPHFYKEDVGDKQSIKHLLANSADANLVGEEAVQCGVELGLIEKENIIKVDGVPHAIFSVMQE